MHLCRQGDTGNESCELGAGKNTRGRYEYHISTVSTLTGQTVSQEKQAVRAETGLGMALGASVLVLKSFPDQPRQGSTS